MRWIVSTIRCCFSGASCAAFVEVVVLRCCVVVVVVLFCGALVVARLGFWAVLGCWAVGVVVFVLVVVLFALLFGFAF